MLRNHNILDDGHAFEKPDVLKGAGYAEPGDPVGRHMGYIGIREDNAPPGRLHKAGKTVEEGGLARAVRSDDAQDHPAFERETDLLYRSDAAEMF
jgi:hypothetical protein